MSLRHLAGLIAALILSQPGIARELSVPEETLIQVELATVATVAGTDAPVVVLRDPGSGNVVPIFIGPTEARAILMALHGVVTPRPMTHDLLSSVIGKLSGTLESVVVDDLREGTYHGALEVRVSPDNTLIRIDARPSDALALAARSGAEIRVAPKVLQAGIGIEFEGLPNDQVVSAIGITVVEATQTLREALSLPDTPGVLVTHTTGRPALVGLAAGALLLSVNGNTPTDPMHFLELVNNTPQGEHAALRFFQNGETRQISVPTNQPATRSPRPITL